METPTVIEDLQRALERGGLADAEDGLAEHATLHVPGRTGLAGPYRGRAAILGFVDKLAAVSDGSFRFRAEHVLVDRDLVMVLGHASCRPRAGARHAPVVLALTVATGRVIDIRVFHHDQPSLDELC
jgi:ketosteroid isomerase-like protein